MKSIPKGRLKAPETAWLRKRYGSKGTSLKARLEMVKSKRRFQSCIVSPEALAREYIAVARLVSLEDISRSESEHPQTVYPSRGMV